MSKQLSILVLVVIVIIIGMYLINANMYPKIEVKPSDIGGRGVFSRAYFAPGDVIERCHTIKGPSDDWGDTLNDYLFDSVKDKDTHLLALGNGSLYNHQDDPNATYEVIPDTDMPDHSILVVKAVKHIKSGEEIFVNYGDDWFSDRNMIPK